jgi:hypothetical protein
VLDKIVLVNGWSSPSRYSIAVGIFILAWGLRLWLFPGESGLAPLTLYPALSLLICGTGPGVLVAVLSALAGCYRCSPCID